MTPCSGVVVGVAVLDFTDVFAPSLVFGRGGGLPGARQTVHRSEKNAGIHSLRYAPQRTPLVLILDNEYFVCVDGPEREGERRGAVRRPLAPV